MERYPKPQNLSKAADLSPPTLRVPTTIWNILRLHLGREEEPQSKTSLPSRELRVALISKQLNARLRLGHLRIKSQHRQERLSFQHKRQTWPSKLHKLQLETESGQLYLINPSNNLQERLPKLSLNNPSCPSPS